MPLYEYHCKNCDDSFEVLQPMGGMVAEMTCPEGHEGAQKVLSVFATVVKGDACAVPDALPAASCTPGGCASCN